ncbi:unnamed protein product [Calypogeia fissa]
MFIQETKQTEIPTEDDDPHIQEKGSQLTGEENAIAWDQFKQQEPVQLSEIYQTWMAPQGYRLKTNGKQL